MVTRRLHRLWVFSQGQTKAVVCSRITTAFCWCWHSETPGNHRQLRDTYPFLLIFHMSGCWAPAWTAPLICVDHVAPQHLWHVFPLLMGALCSCSIYIARRVCMVCSMRDDIGVECICVNFCTVVSGGCTLRGWCIMVPGKFCPLGAMLLGLFTKGPCLGAL